MLYIKNASFFRKYYKEVKSGLTDPNIKTDFVDISHPNSVRKERGFAGLAMGFGRNSIKGFIRSTVLNVAADQQSVYELIQNADDSDSDFISINYNEKYLLCINNGKPFSYSDMSSIINIGDSNKTAEEIGTYGIGFKIVHRLLGKDDGADAIIDDYVGAILFSWNKYIQFEKFISNDKIIINRDENRDEESPWLVKLIYTCFPTHLEESIRLSDYETQKPVFKNEELNELKSFLEESLSKIDNSKEDFYRNCSKGSIFFIKLGEGKYDFIEKNIENLRSGIRYSFNFLQSLKKIYINGESLKAKEVNTFPITYEIDSDIFNQISPRNKERNIEAKFGYRNSYKEPLGSEIPNFYNFFSLDDEKNELGFILHCNAFDMHNDRRKLQPDSQINPRLFPYLINEILSFVEQQKGKRTFNELYAAFLLSTEPKNKPQIQEGIYFPIKKYLLENIPTSNKSYSKNPKNVKIKNTGLNINLVDLDCPEIEWFLWQEKTDAELIKESRNPEKLGLEKWNIIELFEFAMNNGKLENINSWIKKIEFETSQIKEKDVFKPYLGLLNEINKNTLKSNLSIIGQIKLLKFSNGEFYSFDEVFADENLILNYDKIAIINPILRNRLEFITSNWNISKSNNIYELLKDKFNDSLLFQKITSRTKESKLSINEKKDLFLVLVEISGNDTRKIRDLEVFCNTLKEVKPLRKLIQGDLPVANWLFQFKVINGDYSTVPELKAYCVKQEEIYKNIICDNWATIIQFERLKLQEFYEQVTIYYQENKDNLHLSKLELPYIATNEGFKSPKDVFYNSNFLQITHLNYLDFQSAIYKLTDTLTPQKQVLSFLNEAPFEVKNSNLLDSYNLNTNTELNLDEIKAILVFCMNNKEAFFQEYVIEKRDKIYFISAKSENIFQVRPPSKEAKEFIEINLSESFKILPYDLDEDKYLSKNEIGVFNGIDFYNQLIDSIDIEDFRTELVHIIKNDEPKWKFLLALSEIRLIVGQFYDKESFEYKVLDWACNKSILKEEGYPKFREKIIIVTTDGNKKMSDILLTKDTFEIGGITLNLSKILPNEYGNGKYLSELISYFDKLGLPKDRLNIIFGINQEPEPNIIFELLSESVKLLENEQQLAFLILYNHLETIDFNKFEVETLDRNWGLIYSYYTVNQSFIGDDYILEDKYNSIEKLFEELPIFINEPEKKQLLKEPYFTESEFICPNLKNELSDGEKIDLIDFIFNQWGKKNKKVLIKNIDWSKIDNIEIEKLLGFNPNFSVYPDDFALKVEQLPEYLQVWISNDKQKVDFLSDLGVYTENSVLVQLRRHFRENIDFPLNQIATNYKNEDIYFNIFEWLKANKIELQNDRQLETFKKVIEVINDNRRNNGDLKVQIEYDFELLQKNSKELQIPSYESWKSELENKFAIFLYDDSLPNIIKLDEIENYVFYRFNKGDAVIDENNNIYVNQKVDFKKALKSIADENFTYKHYIDLFESTDNVIKDVSISAEDKHLLEKVKEFGSDKIIELITKLEGRDLDDVIKVGMRAFSNIGAMINTGNEGEKIVFKDLIATFGQEKVDWTSKENPNLVGSPTNEYDFIVYIDNSKTKILYYVDAKSTTTEKYGTDKTEINWRNSEWKFIEEKVESNYLVARVFDVNSINPEIVYLKVNPIRFDI